MIKVAVIGCGAMGLMHLHCYNALSEKVQVIAVADADPNKTKSAVAISGADTKIYSDANVLIEQEKPDVIDICLPTFLHAKFAKAAMEKLVPAKKQEMLALNIRALELGYNYKGE